MTIDVATDDGAGRLTTAEWLQIKQSAAVLQLRWKGQFNTETIERFMIESMDQALPWSG